MLTPRRTAQLGLGGGCLVLVSCLTVLVAGASDRPRLPQRPGENTAAQVADARGQAILAPADRSSLRPE